MQIIALLTFSHIIIVAYTIIGVISLVAYLPQIMTLWRSNSSSKDISLQTWSIWSLNALVSMFYAVFVLQDLIASLVFGVDFLGALCILWLATMNRVKSGDFNLHSVRIAAVCKSLANR